MQSDEGTIHRPRDASGIGRPGWREVAVGLVTLAVVGFGGGIAVARLGLDPIVTGLIFAALSGIAGIAGWAAAVVLGSRRVSDFGLRSCSTRWLVIGVCGGLLASVVKIAGIMLYVRLFGRTADIQAIYAAGASGGVPAAVLATLFLAGLTPLGEELLFRGVVVNALLRHGPVIGVIGGGLVFAMFHGPNIVFPAALSLGLVASELFRRSGSVWPGVVAHAVLNLPAVWAMVANGR